jgi:predicted amidohydrolase YtcJ
MAMTTIYQAKVVTMTPSQPLATHVAMRDGRILGAGTLEELAGWGPTNSIGFSQTRC